MWDMDIVYEFLPRLWSGLIITVEVTILATLLALVYGLVMAVLERSPAAPVRRLVGMILEFVRRTPPLIQLYFAFYVLPSIGFMLDGFTCGVIVMGIHRFETADLAWLLFQLAGLHGSLHGKVGIIFDRIGATPVGLAGIGFQHGGRPGL